MAAQISGQPPASTDNGSNPWPCRVSSIPPTAVTVAFQSRSTSKAWSRSAPDLRRHGHITEQAFKAGLDVAQKVKTGQLKLDKNFAPEASKGKPTVPDQERILLRVMASPQRLRGGRPVLRV
jgi:hypothetical protein